MVAVFVKKKEGGGIVMQSWQSVVVMVTADDYYVQVAGVVLGLSESLPAAGILRMSIRWKGKVYLQLLQGHPVIRCGPFYI